MMQKRNCESEKGDQILTLVVRMLFILFSIFK